MFVVAAAADMPPCNDASAAAEDGGGSGASSRSLARLIVARRVRSRDTCARTHREMKRVEQSRAEQRFEIENHTPAESTQE